MKATVNAAITAVVAAGLALACGGSSATAYERFPEYENVQEVPVIGSLKSHIPRVGPLPSRSAVRLATHYLRIARESSNVRCHGISGPLIACRVHITGSGAKIAARLTLTPEGKLRDRIIRCETTRLISGRPSEATCFDFMVWHFNKWQEGPPHHLPRAKKAPAAATRKPPPPKAWTTEAQSFESTVAFLNGHIDPRGVPTVYRFEYGSTKSYGRSTAVDPEDAISRKLHEVEAVVHGLQPGTSYHFRIVAISKGGKTYGGDKTFTTFKPQTARPGTVIACFHEKISRFTPQAHPGQCDIWGYRGKQFVGVPVKGMKWGHWGFNPARAAFGIDKLNGKSIRIIAYRPITCDEGRTWYSRVVVLFPGDGTELALRLLTCDGPSVIG